MHLVRQLPGYAIDGFALLAMVFLTAFSVGYSRLIGAIANQGDAGVGLHLAGLNFVFSALTTVVSALVLLGLSRREAWRDDQLPPPRVGPFIGVIVGLFLLGLVVQTLWQLIMVGMLYGGGEWLMTAVRLPATVLQIVLFQVVVWQVVLARGSSQPSFGTVWSQIWSRGAVLVGVAIIAVASLAASQVGQWASTENHLSQDIGEIAFAGPAAIARVLDILLAIIVARDMIQNYSPAAVF